MQLWFYVACVSKGVAISFHWVLKYNCLLDFYLSKSHIYVFTCHKPINFYDFISNRSDANLPSSLTYVYIRSLLQNFEFSLQLDNKSLKPEKILIALSYLTLMKETWNLWIQVNCSAPWISLKILTAQQWVNKWNRNESPLRFFSKPNKQNSKFCLVPVLLYVPGRISARQTMPWNFRKFLEFMKFAVSKLNHAQARGEISSKNV